LKDIFGQLLSQTCFWHNSIRISWRRFNWRGKKSNKKQ